MEGVVCENADKDIKIINGKEKGTQVVLLQTTGKLTKDKAVEAIGQKYDKFVVVSVKEGAPKEDKKTEGKSKKGKSKEKSKEKVDGESKKKAA